MITREELLYQASVFDLNESDIQRDYVFGWIISGVFSESALGSEVVLKGGNALRKAYLPGTRFSDDLDFSAPRSLDPGHVLNQLNRACEFAAASSGIRFDVPRNRQTDARAIDSTKHVYKYRLYFKDMIGGQDHLKISLRVDVTEFDRLHLPTQQRLLIHPYSDADQCGATIHCISLEEALADKLKCLLQRRYCYDIFDLVHGAFVSHDIPVDRAALMNVFLRKTTFGASPVAAKSLLLDLPLHLFRGYWDKVLVPLASRITFDEAIARLTAGVEDLFSPYGRGAHSELAFFPSQLRNIILQAGAERKLLELTYDGYRRVVEPYSLQFKRPAGQPASEYLFVFDRVGGKRGPSIKSFFHHKIRDLVMLEETFDPRYEVELSKAGDVSQSGHFGGNAGPGRSQGAYRAAGRRANGYHGMTYVVACRRCGKEFQRTQRSTQINAHKDPYGRACASRAGYLVRVA
jgi:predicted nucleotidyltransferase component of viral defense system